MDRVLYRVIIFAVVVAAIATLIGVIGDTLIAYWPIVLLLAAAVVGGVVYLKRRKRASNIV